MTTVAKREKGLIKPFGKKTFYLDLKGFRQESNLARDLRILGGKQETFLSKDVSFVVSNQIPLKYQQLNSSMHKSSSTCPSPQLFNESIFDCTDSPTYLNSPGFEQNVAPMSRGLALLQKAKLKTQGTGDIMEVCRQWNIKVYHVQKVLSWIEKYKNIYYKNYVAQEKQERKKSIKVSQDAQKIRDIQKIRAPFIKVEDIKRKYKTRYKVLGSWSQIINPELSRNINQLHKQFKVSGNIDIFRPALKEVNSNTVNHKTQNSFLHPSNNKTVSASLTKRSGNLLVSHSFMTPWSDRKDKVQDVDAQKKEKNRKRAAKKKFCEICDVYFENLDDHLKTKSHEKYMKDSSRFSKVQEVIASLPNLSDFLKVSESDLQPEYIDVPPEFPILHSNVLQNEREFCQPNDDYFNMPVLENMCIDSGTDLYSLKEEDYISASCSSTDCTTLPYLEDSIGNIAPNSGTVCASNSFTSNFIAQNVSDEFHFPAICPITNASPLIKNFASPVPLESAVPLTAVKKCNFPVVLNVSETLNRFGSQETDIEKTVSLMDEFDFQGIFSEKIIKLDTKVVQTEEHICDNRQLNRIGCMFTTADEKNLQLSNSNISLYEYNDKHIHMKHEGQVQPDLEVIKTGTSEKQQSKLENLLNKQIDERIEFYAESPSVGVSISDEKSQLCNLKNFSNDQDAFVETESQLTDCTTFLCLEDSIKYISPNSGIIGASSSFTLNGITQNSVCSATNAAPLMKNFATPALLENVDVPTALVNNNSIVGLNVTENLNKFDSQEIDIEKTVSLIVNEMMNKLDSKIMFNEKIIELDNKVVQTEEQFCTNRELSRIEHTFTTANEKNLQLSNSSILIYEHSDKRTDMTSEGQAQPELEVIKMEASKFENLSCLNEQIDEYTELNVESPSVDVIIHNEKPQLRNLKDSLNDQNKHYEKDTFVEIESQLINTNTGIKEPHSYYSGISIRECKVELEYIEIESSSVVANVENRKPEENIGISMDEQGNQIELGMCIEKERSLISMNLDEEKSLLIETSVNYQNDKNIELISVENESPLITTKLNKDFQLCNFRNSLNGQDKSIELDTCAEHPLQDSINEQEKNLELDTCVRSRQHKRKSSVVFDDIINDFNCVKSTKSDVSEPKRHCINEDLNISSKASFAEVYKTNDNIINDGNRRPMHILDNEQHENNFTLATELSNVESFLENVFTLYKHEQSKKSIELKLFENDNVPVQVCVDSELRTINSTTQSSVIKVANSTDDIQSVYFTDKPMDSKSNMIDSNITLFEKSSVLNTVTETLNSVVQSENLPGASIEKIDQETSNKTCMVIKFEDTTSQLNNQNYDHSVCDLVYTHEGTWCKLESDASVTKNFVPENENLIDIKRIIVEKEVGKIPVNVDDEQIVSNGDEHKDVVSTIENDVLLLNECAVNSVSSIPFDTHISGHFKNAAGVEAVEKEIGITSDICVKYSFDQKNVPASPHTSSINCIYRQRKLKLPVTRIMKTRDRHVFAKNYKKDLLLRGSHNLTYENDAVDLTTSSPGRQKFLFNKTDSSADSVGNESFVKQNQCNVRAKESFAVDPENCILCQKADQSLLNNTQFMHISNPILSNPSFICIEGTDKITQNSEHYVFDCSKKGYNSLSSNQTIVINASSFEDADFSSDSDSDCMWQSLHSEVDSLYKSIDCGENDDALDLSLNNPLKA